MSPRVVSAGGYGLVGGLVARHLRAAGHALDLVLAGRNPDQGASLAAELGARTARLDVADPAAALAELGPVDLVVATLQDPGDNLLAAALAAGAAHIGIVRTADSMASTAIAASAPPHHGHPCWMTSTAETAPVSATTDPTERSMWPAMITMTMPMASTRM